LEPFRRAIGEAFGEPLSIRLTASEVPGVDRTAVEIIFVEQVFAL